MNRPTSGAGVAFLSVFLVGCNSTAKQRASLFENAGKTREALALAGVNKLREAFNQGACQSIFDEADLVFRLRQSQQGWLNECQTMRQKLGLWWNFQAHLEHGPGLPIRVEVYGDVGFSKGSGRLDTAWHFDRGHAVLFSLFLDGMVRPSPSLRRRDRYLDPPLKSRRETV